MKKGTVFLLTFLFLCILALTACSAASKNDDMAANESTSNSAPQESWDADNDTGLTKEPETSFASADSSIYSDPDAKVIRTAELIIQTTEFDQSVASLAALTEKQGGYYESASVDGGYYYDQYANRFASFVVRIPKENFTAFLNEAGEVGHLYSMTESSENVGEIYYDTEARLAALETKRERLLALLNKAELMEDIIALENALSETQYEIDMHNTSLRKYDSLIDYATFHISLEEVVKISNEPAAEDGFLTKLGISFEHGFTGFVEGLEGAAFWVARNIIGIVLLAAVVVVVWRLFHRYRKKRHATPPNQE